MSDLDLDLELEPEECFELIEYVNLNHKILFQNFLENKIREWLLKNRNLEDEEECLKEKISLQEGNFELKCYFHLGLKKENGNSTNKAGVDEKRRGDWFPCQGFVFHPDNGNEKEQEELIVDGGIIKFDFRADKLFRWFGFPIFLTLSTIKEQPRKSHYEMDNFNNSLSKNMEPKRSDTLSEPKAEAEMSRFLLDSGRKALKKLKICDVPLIVETGKKSFEGLMWINEKELYSKEETKFFNEEEDSNTGLLQTFFYSSCMTINPANFSDLKKVVEFYKDLSQRHYQGKLFIISFSFKLKF